jgi:arylsulfatase A-like enzyme
VQSGVRFVQLFHWGWDHHGDSKDTDIRHGLVDRCRETDQANAALIKDLKRLGLLDSTLIVWGGEFGRTPMNEERNGSKWLGRDHNQTAFSIWMAGGGVKAGQSLGSTDELGYHVVEDGVHVHDLQATILHLLGLNHEKLTYRFQGRDYRLTDVFGKVVNKLLA